MNCACFDPLAADLAEERLTPGVLRDEAVNHAMACARCDARLADERALAADLRALGLATDAAKAPRRLEKALVAAFRGRRVERATPRPIHLRGGLRTWRWGVAAALAVAAAIGTVREVQREAPSGRQVPPAPIAPRQAVTTPRDGATVSAAKAAPAPRVARRRPAIRPGVGTTAVRTEDRRTGDRDPEFIPLDYGDPLTDIESVQLVRVQLPPSAIAALGWPIGDEGATRLVNADLVVGQDGVARAIHLVP